MDSIDYAKKWLNFANADYSVALFIQNHHPVPIEIICYHCQQAGEKALKAVLAYHNKEIPKTNDLYKLLELCEQHYTTIKSGLSEQAVSLSNLATITRYPDNAIELTDTDMATALKYAKQVLSYLKTCKAFRHPLSVAGLGLDDNGSRIQPTQNNVNRKEARIP